MQFLDLWLGPLEVGRELVQELFDRSSAGSRLVNCFEAWGTPSVGAVRASHRRGRYAPAKKLDFGGGSDDRRTQARTDSETARHDRVGQPSGRQRVGTRPEPGGAGARARADLSARGARPRRRGRL